MVISYPIPPYQNMPIEPDYYKPRHFFISSISLGQQTTVDTTVDHDFVIGQQVRLIIPPDSGCRQLNERTGFVISIPTSSQVIIDIDSSQNVDPFTSSSSRIQPQILAIGDINTGTINSQGRINQSTSIPGAFINISPN